MANTEAFHRFNAFSEEFDRNIKVTFGCLEWLRSSKPHSTVKHAQLSTGGEPWGKSILLRDPVGQALSAVRFISTMGIVRAIAALEDYLTVLEADHSRTAFLRTNNCKLPRPVFASERVSFPLSNTSCDLGVAISALSEVMPLYQYFTIARHCIVHRGGRASDEMASIATSSEVARTHTNWKTNKGTSLPALPKITVDQEIDWLPRHAILCMAICYKAATLLDSEVTCQFGDSGLIYMAAYYSILSDDRLKTNATKSPERIIATALHNRYRFREMALPDIVAELRKMNKWDDCYQAFKNISKS